MQKIKGWIVVLDNQSKRKPIPVSQKFFMAKACANCLRDEMNLKKLRDPKNYLYPYKIIKATLLIDK